MAKPTTKIHTPKNLDKKFDFLSNIMFVLTTKRKKKIKVGMKSFTALLKTEAIKLFIFFIIETPFCFSKEKYNTILLFGQFF